MSAESIPAGLKRSYAEKAPTEEAGAVKSRPDCMPEEYCRDACLREKFLKKSPPNGRRARRSRRSVGISGGSLREEWSHHLSDVLTFPNVRA
jgi:hypothetical protein